MKMRNSAFCRVIVPKPKYSMRATLSNSVLVFAACVRLGPFTQVLQRRPGTANLHKKTVPKRRKNDGAAWGHFLLELVSHLRNSNLQHLGLVPASMGVLLGI